MKKIIGNGLIAKSLVDIDFGQPVLVLASGVSDSQETRVEEFQREINVVTQAMESNPNLHVLYCSTCSVDSGADTPYIAHKLAMEKRVLAGAMSCHVLRLPQVVGLVHNNTLVSHFVSAILHNRLLKIHTRATRNLLDVRDFARIATLAVRQGKGIGSPQNIASSTQVPVLNIVNEIARLLGRPVRTETVNAGYSHEIDSTFLENLLPADDPLFDPCHWRKVLQYYVPLMAATNAVDPKGEL